MKLNLIIILLCFIVTTQLNAQEVLASSLDKIPQDWKGKVFKLSKKYPTQAPSTVDQPWKKFDFKTQPAEYIAAVKKYVVEGNIECDWVFEKNKVRKWYHAPSMIWGNNGREFINGLTRERSSRPEELHPNQKTSWQNWAVGFYNEPGGYTIGQVYADPYKPNVTNVIFPEGTVAAKLLFTNAPDVQVPYMANSFTWDANIHTALQGSSTRVPAKMRLLQMDVAIKDNRAANATDWIMITFAYHKDAPGQTAFDKLVPVGIQWGNDPNSLVGSKQLTETWINPLFKTLFTVGKWTMHTGYKGRLNGPVDNPNSSCLSCHGTAQFPGVSTGMIPNINNDNSLKNYFKNLNPPALFEDLPNKKESTLDYSLQLSVGIPQAIARAPKVKSNRSVSGPAPDGESTPLDSVDTENVLIFLTTRDFEDEENADLSTSVQIQDTQSSQPDIIDVEKAPETPQENGNLLYWLGAILAAIGSAIWYFMRGKQ